MMSKYPPKSMMPQGHTMKPKGKKGRAMVAKLGRTKKTGVFDQIVKNAKPKYGKEVADKIAGKIFWGKARA